MAKHKFKFDPETLQYKSVASNTKRRITMVVTQLMAAFVFAFILFIIMSYISETPKQKKYRRENQMLVEQYKILQERKKQTDVLLQELKERDKRIHRAILETDPIEDSSFAENADDLFKGDNIEDIATNNEAKISELNSLIEENIKQYKNILNIVRSKSEELVNIPAIQPVKNINFKYTLYGYGNRIDPVYKTPAFHPGVDFAAPQGTNVYATANGTVSRVDSKQRGMGNNIKIDHGNGYSTLYAHLDRTKVYTGQKIKRGEMIGTVGSTGKSFIPHLHYEVLFKGENINPVNYFFLDLSPYNYETMQYHASRVGLSLD